MKDKFNIFYPKKSQIIFFLLHVRVVCNGVCKKIELKSQKPTWDNLGRCLGEAIEKVIKSDCINSRQLSNSRWLIEQRGNCRWNEWDFIVFGLFTLKAITNVMCDPNGSTQYIHKISSEMVKVSRSLLCVKLVSFSSQIPMTHVRFTWHWPYIWKKVAFFPGISPHSWGEQS